jgi:hypothetical protein
MFEIQDISLENQLLYIKFKSKDALENLKVEFRAKDMTRYAVSAFNQFFESEITSKEKIHEIKVDISTLSNQFHFDNLTKQIVWIYINNQGVFHQLKPGNKISEKLKGLGSVSFCDLAKMSMVINRNFLALSIAKVNVSSILKNITSEEGSLLLDLMPITLNNKEIPISTVQVKKRIFKDTLIYSQGVELKNISPCVYSLELHSLNSLDYDMVNNLDFITTIKDRNVSVELPILLNEKVKLSACNFNDNLKSKLYSTVKKSLSLRVEKKHPTASILNTVTDNQLINLEIDLSALQLMSYDNLKCGLFRQNILFNDTELTIYQSIPLHFKDSKASISLDVLDLFSEVQTNYEQQYIIALFDETDHTNVVIHLTADEKIVHKTNGDHSVISINIHKEAGIVLMPKTAKPIRLSILGSCFSRAAFNSSNPFFNKDYKYYFNLDYSHFWISLISAVSDKIPFVESKFSDVPPKVIDNVKKEYEKTTFEDLKKVHSDYVVLDFFVDAVHGVRRVGDDKFLGQNGDMHNSYYYKNHILKETSQFDFRHPDFWDTWTRSCDEFIDRLGKVINLNKIILNLGGLSDLYYNENREISSFSKDKKFTVTEVNFINHTWEKMNNYFLSKVPAARVIDLSEYNYLASLDYPYGGSGPHHYERNYYKTFLGELSKIVLKDKLH